MPLRGSRIGADGAGRARTPRNPKPDLSGASGSRFPTTDGWMGQFKRDGLGLALRMVRVVAKI